MNGGLGTIRQSSRDFPRHIGRRIRKLGGIGVAYLDPDILFLRTVDECRQVLTAPDDYSILRSTALLRQLLLDGNRLIDVVNRSRRERVRFLVCDGWDTPYAKEVLSDNPLVFAVADGLHPERNLLPGVPQREFNRDRFLKFPVVYASGNYYTVGDIITHCANVLGGVHVGSPKTNEEEQLSALQQFQIGKSPLSLRQLLPILHVVVDSLEALYQRISEEITV